MGGSIEKDPAGFKNLPGGVLNITIFLFYLSPHFTIFSRTKKPIMEENNFWKERAIERRLENKELHKRKKELIRSRDNWKEKYHTQKAKADRLEHELELIKKKLNDILLT